MVNQAFARLSRTAPGSKQNNGSQKKKNIQRSKTTPGNVAMVMNERGVIEGGDVWQL